MNPTLLGSIQSAVPNPDSDAVLLRASAASPPDTIPLAVSNTNQLPVAFVRLNMMNRAPPVNPQSITRPVVPSPVYEPTLLTPGQEAKR